MTAERTKTQMAREMPSTKPNGPAAAAILASGIGVFTTGLMTSLAEASTGLRSALVWRAPVGPLSGKTGVGVIVWLAAWVILGTMWRGRTVNVGRALTWTVVLIVLGFLLTFPPVFELFVRE